MAQVAVYKAVRTGSFMYGNCDAMKHTAIAVLLPTITRTDSPKTLGDAFRLRRDNKYSDGSPVHRGQIVEIYRQSPQGGNILAPQNLEDERFDQPTAPGQPPQLERLEVRMIYWYRLKIPFADWVMSRMFLAHYNLEGYTRVNPLMPAANAKWGDDTSSLAADGESWPGGSLGSNMANWSRAGAYLFPIRVTATMKMMTPPRRSDFPSQGCPL
jgi:hypothetical protein